MASGSPGRRQRGKPLRGIYKRVTDGGSVWLARVRLRGFTPVSRTFETRDAAAAWLMSTTAALKRQRGEGEVRADVSRLTVAGLIREYLDEPKTRALRSYDNKLELLARWWLPHYGAKRVLDVSVAVLREARKNLEGSGRASATVNRHLSAMRSAWNWGRVAGLVPVERAWPSRGLMLTEPPGRARYLSDTELANLLVAVAENGNRFPALRAMVLLSLGTGIRQGELLRLAWSDVDFKSSTVRIRFAKNKEPRAVHAPTAVLDALRVLKKLPVVSAEHPFVDTSGEPITKGTLHHPWNTIRTAAGLKDFKWHDLRHSCASYLAQAGATLSEIGSVLGHRSPVVTLRYAHLVAGKPVTGADKLNEKLKGA